MSRKLFVVVVIALAAWLLVNPERNIPRALGWISHVCSPILTWLGQV